MDIIQWVASLDTFQPMQPLESLNSSTLFWSSPGTSQKACHGNFPLEIQKDRWKVMLTKISLLLILTMLRASTVPSWQLSKLIRISDVRREGMACTEAVPNCIGIPAVIAKVFSSRKSDCLVRRWFVVWYNVVVVSCSLSAKKFQVIVRVHKHSSGELHGMRFYEAHSKFIQRTLCNRRCSLNNWNLEFSHADREHFGGKLGPDQ